jgi:exonuclease III
MVLFWIRIWIWIWIFGPVERLLLELELIREPGNSKEMSFIKNDISFEFPGYCSSNSRNNRSTGTAIAVLRTNGLTRNEDDDHVDNEGRLAGMALKHSSGEKYYILSAYAPSCDRSTQAINYSFLLEVSLKMFQMRDKGYTVLTGGDLNCIRDESLDSRNSAMVSKKSALFGRARGPDHR